MRSSKTLHTRKQRNTLKENFKRGKNYKESAEESSSHRIIRGKIMPSDKSIAWLGKQKEKEALNLSKQHMKEIVESTRLMKEAVYEFCEDGKNIEIDSDKVFEKEKDADQIKSKILIQLSEGNFPPINREKIMRLVTTADDIADNARAAAMKLTFLDPANISRDVKDGLMKLSDYAYESTIEMREAFLALLEDPESAIEKTEDVEKMEEKIDFFRSENLTPHIIKWADESHLPGTANILTEVEDNIEEVADQAENCADSIREIAIGSL